MRRHERAPEVRLAGAQRAVGTQEQEAVVARGAQREHRRPGVGVDEDLVSRRGAQRRAALAQRVGRAHQAHGVDRVVHERTVGEPPASRARRRRRAAASAYHRAFAPGAPGRRVVRGRRRPGAAGARSRSVSTTSLHQPPQPGRSRRAAPRARSTCCARPRARRAPAARGRGRRRTVRRRPRPRCAGRPGPRRPASRSSTSSIAPENGTCAAYSAWIRRPAGVGSCIPTSCT